MSTKSLEAYILVYYHGLSYAEAGELLGISKQAVHKRLKRDFPNRPLKLTAKTLSYNPTMDAYIKDKF